MIFPAQTRLDWAPLRVQITGTRSVESVRDTDSDYVMKSHRGAGRAPFRDTGRLLQAVSKLLVLLKTPLFP